MHEEKDGPLMRRYMRTMQWCLRHRGLTAIAAALFFAASISLVPLLPTGFVPAADRGQTIRSTSSCRPAPRWRRRAPWPSRRAWPRCSVPGVKHRVQLDRRRLQRRRLRARRRGRGAARGADRDAPYTAASATNRCRPRTPDPHELSGIPGARFHVGQADTGGKLQLVLRSEDPVALAAAAQRAERELRGLHGIGNVSSSASLVRPEIIVRPTSRARPTWA
jgi:multidrug efflux pump subunit AcrB